MTIREKFKKQLDTATPKLNRPNYQAKQCEKIADDYAIKFANWFTNEITSETKLQWWIKGEKYTDCQLLEMFKKEKGW